MKDWYNTPIGQYILQAETDAISPFLERWFGFHLVQIGGPQNIKLLQESPIPHHIYLFPQAINYFSQTYVVSEFNDLPLLPNSVDVIVMPHVLEFIKSPNHVLQQAYLSLVGGGHLVVFGFNPYSLWGLKQWLNIYPKQLDFWRGVARVSKRSVQKVHEHYELSDNKAKNSSAKGIWQQAHFISRHQLQHKLIKTGFTVIDCQNFFYRPPVNSKLWLNRWHFMERVGAVCWPALSSIYMFVAKKEVVALVKTTKAKKAVKTVVTKPVLVEPRQRI